MRQEQPDRPTRNYFTLLAWALLLFNVALALTGWLLAQFLGNLLAFGLFVGTGLITTVALLQVVALNALAVWVYDWWRRRHPRT